MSLGKVTLSYESGAGGKVGWAGEGTDKKDLGHDMGAYGFAFATRLTYWQAVVQVSLDMTVCDLARTVSVSFYE